MPTNLGLLPLHHRRRRQPRPHPRGARRAEAGRRHDGRSSPATTATTSASIGLGDKRSAYEESLRIPLLVRYPRLGLRGKTIDRMALNIDLAPTLLDFAGRGASPPDAGRSWRPLLEGKEGGLADAFFYGYFFERGYRIPTVTAVRTETAKLIKYPGHDEWTELFDLSGRPVTRRGTWSTTRATRTSAGAGGGVRAAGVGDRFPHPRVRGRPEEGRRRSRPSMRGSWTTASTGTREDEVVDASGREQPRQGPRRPAGGGPRGWQRAAVRRQGAIIEIPKTPEPEPGREGGWTVEATVQARAGHGRSSWRAGAGRTAMRCTSTKASPCSRSWPRTGRRGSPGGSRWARAGCGSTAQVTTDQKLQQLYVDGELVGESPTPCRAQDAGR